MRTEAEAPAAEPRDVSRRASTSTACARRSAPSPALRRRRRCASRRGEIVAVVGPSGCGKSTLLELVCGLSEPDARRASRAGPAALMPQRDALLPWLSALDNAGARAAGRRARRARRRARGGARALRARSGSRASSARGRRELSGGMRQRVAFLRTLLAGRPVLCLDEPFGALDALTRAQMQRWLAEALAREPRTVLLVTHDVEEAVAARRPRRAAVAAARAGSSTSSRSTLPRPRERTDLAVVELRERALRGAGGAR